MHIDLTPGETDYLRTVLETARKELLHELHHVTKQDFKGGLKRQLETNEKILEKVAPALQHVAVSGDAS